METSFTLEQLRDPKLREANDILRRCVHCGFCTATCPTYLLLGDERDSPRGRIYLIKSLLEGEATARQIRPHIDRCLSCYSCMTTCPSGVDYMHLSDFARQKIEKETTRLPGDRLMRKMVSLILPFPKRFRVALIAASFAKPFRKIIKSLGFNTVAAMLDLAPASPLKTAEYAAPQTIKTRHKRRGRVALLSGCAQRVLRPDINDATIRFLNRLGYDVELAADEGCCGALVHHMGQEAEAKTLAKRNIDAWSNLRKNGPLTAIVINASGCGTMVKDYGHLFAQDPDYKDKASFISSLTKDITEIASLANVETPIGWSDIKVAYQSPCSMQHGQQIDELPKQLLKQAGFTVLDIPEGHICCGSAGTYNIFQPDLAGQLRDQKIKAINTVKPDCVASGNIGCITQLSNNLYPVVHTVELLDWFYGGPCPQTLKHLEGRIRPMPKSTASNSTVRELV